MGARDQMKLLFTVDDAFEISGRGLVLVPGVPLDRADEVSIGLPLLIKSADGSETRAAVAAIEFFASTRLGTLPLLVVGVAKDHATAGSTVWTSGDQV